MGREVRMVPADWVHPRSRNGRHVPLLEGYTARLVEWHKDRKEWDAGERTIWDEGQTFADSHGEQPDPDDYMPEWPPEDATSLMMYENTSEGTPISGAFDTPEELARFLAGSGASSFAGMTATYEQWLRMIGAGYSASVVATVTEGGITDLVSGVEAAK